MKRTAFTLLLAMLAIVVQAQERNEMGALLGSTYYMGDYNPSTQFYRPKPAGGLLYRRNLSNFYSIRLSALIGSVAGEHNPDNFFLPGDTPAFSKTFIDIDAVAEIGFLPFHTGMSRPRRITPYALVGVGAAMISNDITAHIPMGIGVKYSPAHRWTVALEWRLHKTFYDNMDDYMNLTDGSRSILHNNDWFGFGGILITYRLINNKAVCPAYE